MSRAEKNSFTVEVDLCSVCGDVAGCPILQQTGDAVEGGGQEIDVTVETRKGDDSRTTVIVRDYHNTLMEADSFSFPGSVSSEDVETATSTPHDGPVVIDGDELVCGALYNLREIARVAK